MIDAGVKQTLNCHVHMDQLSYFCETAYIENTFIFWAAFLMFQHHQLFINIESLHFPLGKPR